MPASRGRRARLFVATALTLACVGSAAPALAAPAAPAGAPALAVESPPAAPTANTIFNTGKQTVAAFAVAPDGRVFYVGPASAKIFVWSPVTKKIETFATVPRAKGGFGLVLSPSFARDHFVYAYVNVGTARGQHEHLLRYTDRKGVGRAYRMLRDVGPMGSEHTGGAMTFSPNGKNLFLMVGDGGNPANSQNPKVDHGKILRLTPLGAAAAGNPGYADKAIWATGFRNSIGLAFDSQKQRLWETENGPECNDEINSISGNSNYGWGPRETCDGTVEGTNQDGPDPVLPAENLDTTVAPTGITFCNGCGVAGADGALVYGRYLTSDLRKVTLDATRTSIVSDELLYQDSSKVLAVQTSPVDGSMWFADSANNMQKLS